MSLFSYSEVACVEAPASADAVNEKAYRRVNPDIAQSGLSAREHFRQYGAKEGRKQAVNQHDVAAMREEKLARLKFRDTPHRKRRYGEAANFITPTLAREFRIPPFPPVSSHTYGSFLTDLQKAHPDWLFLDVGAGLRDSVSSNMVNVDIFDAVSTDIVCIGERLPFEDNQFDYIICGAVLEHTRRPWDVAREICRVLKPGGMARIDYPFLQPVHDYPAHYFNATPEGNISLFEKWCEIESCTVEDHMHPLHSLKWIIQVWKSGLPPEIQEKFGRMTIDELIALPESRLLQEAFCRDLAPSVKLTICAGSTLVARKKPAPSLLHRASRHMVSVLRNRLDRNPDATGNRMARTALQTLRRLYK